MKIKVIETNNKYYIQDWDGENWYSVAEITPPKKYEFYIRFQLNFNEGQSKDIISFVIAGMNYYKKQWNCKNIALTLKEIIENKLESYIIEIGG